jgi:hypothetical protein
MMSYPLNDVNADGSGQVLWEDGERVFRRGWRLGDGDNRSAVLVVQPAAEHPSPSSLERLTHEYGFKDVEQVRTFGIEWSAHPIKEEVRA